MKTLIIAAHPHIGRASATPCTSHTADNPHGRIDVPREQSLVEAHGGVVWQVPVYLVQLPAAIGTMV